MAKTIADYKREYAAARKKGDYLGMRAANVAANKIRKSKGLPSYSSTKGDKQYSLSSAKINQPLQQKIKQIPQLTKKTPTLKEYKKPSTHIKDNDRNSEVIRQGYKRLIKKSPSTRAYFGFREGIMPISTKGMIKKRYGEESLNTLEKSKAFKGGEIGGVVAGFAIPYAGAEGAVAQGVSKIPKIARLGKVGQAVTKSVATDLAVGIPLNTNYAFNKKGLRGKEALKDIGTNTALDIGLGAGLEGIGYILGKTLKSGKRINSKEDLKNLTKAEHEEVMSELERLAYESNVRKGKIKPNNDTIYGNSFNKDIAGALPGPKTTQTSESPLSRNISFEEWRKKNFDGAFGKMSDGDMQALHELYMETTEPNYLISKGKRETPFTVRPDEVVKKSKLSSKLDDKLEQYNKLKQAFEKDFKNLNTEQRKMYQRKFNELNQKLEKQNINVDTIQKSSKIPKQENKDIQEKYNEFMSSFDMDEPLGNTGVGEWVNGINGKGVGIGKDITRNADTALKGEARDWFKNTFEDNFYKSKGQYANNVKAKTDLLFNEVVKKRGIQKGSKESAGIQWYGEGKKMINGEPHPYTITDLQEDFSYKMPNGKFAWENIVQSDNIMRNIYDNYVKEINESLKNIYPNAENEVKKMQAKKRGKSLEEMKQIDKEIDKYITGKRLFPRTDYYHHFQELQDGFFSQIDNIMNSATNIDPNLVGISEFTKPKSKFMGALQHRSDYTDYKADALSGMLQYIPQAEYKVNIEPNIPVLRNIIKDLKDYTGGNANQFIDYLMKFTNDLAGKTNPVDRAFLNVLGDETGRKVLNSLGAVSNRVRANAVVGNVNTMLAQFFNMPNVVGYAKNPVDVLNGMVDATKATLGDKEKQNILNKSNFIRERYLDRSMRRFDTGILNNTNKFFSWAMELGDKAIADSAFITFYKQGLKKGLKDKEAVIFADNLTRKSVAGRGIGEMPLEQKAKVTKLFAPFQVEVRNAYNVLKELGSNKDIGGILSIFATTFLMNTALEATTGRRIGFDPIDVLMSSYQEEKTPTEKIKDTTFRMGGEALTNMPFGSYIGESVTNALGLDEYKKRELFGESDPTRFGTGNIAIQTLAAPLGQAVQGKNIDLLKPTMAVAPKFGGKQIERSIRGLQDMAVLPKEKINLGSGVDLKKQPFPASFSAAERLRFTLNPTAKNYVKAPILGTWATKEGKNYIKNGLKPMSDKQTELIENMYQSGINPVKADNMVRNVYEGMSDYKKDTSKSNLSTLEKAYIVDHTIKDKSVKEKLYEHLKISPDTVERLNYLQNQNVSIKQTSEASGLTKKFDTTLGRVMAIIDTYPNNGEIIAKGLGYSDGSIKNAKNLIKNGVTSKQFETYKQNADTDGNGKINTIEAHRILKDESLTMSQKLHLIKNLKGKSLKA